jgi:hypothetical protein
VLEAAWRLRCQRAATQRPFAATDVVDSAIGGIERLVRAEWGATRDVAAVSGTCESWFPRSRRLPSPIFKPVVTRCCRCCCFQQS